jgi:nucleoside phosphorylase
MIHDFTDDDTSLFNLWINQARRVRRFRPGRAREKKPPRGRAFGVVSGVARVLILSAWEPEVASLRRTLARASAQAIARSTVCRPVGVGAIDAAIGAARAIAEIEPTQILFVGTAGGYPSARPTPAIGAVAIPATFLLASTATLRGDGYVPAPMVLRQPATPGLWDQLTRVAPQGAAFTIATSPLAITRTAALARRLARDTGAAVENLEVFAVARAAAAAALPMAAILGIANQVGPQAHVEWRQHHLAASKAACAIAWTWLRARAA